MTTLELIHVLDFSLKTFLVAHNNQAVAVATVFNGLANIRRESALMRFFLNVKTEEIEDVEEWARLNAEMWYSLKITGKVKKNNNGSYSFVV